MACFIGDDAQGECDKAQHPNPERRPAGPDHLLRWYRKLGLPRLSISFRMVGRGFIVEDFDDISWRLRAPDMMALAAPDPPPRCTQRLDLNAISCHTVRANKNHAGTFESPAPGTICIGCRAA